LLFCLCLVDHLDLFLVRLSRQLTPLVFLGFTPVPSASAISIAFGSRCSLTV
jgi:hypothetical protein